MTSQSQNESSTSQSNSTTLKIKATKTVSFDFDHTLWDDDEQAFIWETVALLRSHLSQGHRVIIVTARMPEWIPEVEDLLKRIKLHLEVFCAPGDPEWDTLVTKSQVLIEQEAELHIDDDVDQSGLNEARERGIEIQLPPATEAIKQGMY